MTTTATEDILDAVQTVVATVTGISQVQSSPNETQNTNVWAVIYLTKGRVKMGPSATRRNLEQITIDVCKTRTWLPNDIDVLIPLVDNVCDALIAEVSPPVGGVGGGLFNKKIQTFDEIDIQLLPKLEYAEVTYMGYRLTLSNVKTLVPR